MRPADVVRRAADYLERHDVECPQATAEILLAGALAVPRARLYAREEGLRTAEARRFGRALCLRCAGTPVQHLTGLEGFRRLTLLVRPGVFIPRPETEVVVDIALEALEAVGEPLVVDIGTGTGAIALALKDERPDATVMATDLAPAAVALAGANAAMLDLDIDVREGDGFGPIPDALWSRFDLVVSNPPYVSDEEYAAAPSHVRADPPLALLGGIDTYERLFEAAVDWLRPGGAIVVEIGAELGPAVASAAAARFTGVRVHPDLAGRDRVVSARVRL